MTSLTKKSTYLSFINSLIMATNLILNGSAYSAQTNLSIEEQLRRLEATTGGKLGIAAINTNNGQAISYRAQDHFPMGCTSKMIGVAAVLKKSEREPALLNKHIHYTQKDMVEWAPITEKHLDTGMSVAQLAAAAISYSDNPAMNLLIQQIGGVQGMNTFARSIGDTAFSQNNDWPKEAYSGPQDKTDSSTPSAMLKSMQKIALGTVLTPENRELLLTWMKGNTTGDKRIRAGVPKGWVVADKTGTGFNYGTVNDVAIIWPPQCKPIALTIFYSNPKKDAPKRDDVLAEATRLLLKAYAQKDSCFKV